MSILLSAWFVIGLLTILWERNNRKNAVLTALLLPVLLFYAIVMLTHVITGWLLARIDELVDRVFD